MAETKNEIDELIGRGQSVLEEYGAKATQKDREELIATLAEASQTLNSADLAQLKAGLAKLKTTVFRFSATVQNRGR